MIGDLNIVEKADGEGWIVTMEGFGTIKDVGPNRNGDIIPVEVIRKGLEDYIYTHPVRVDKRGINELRVHLVDIYNQYEYENPNRVRNRWPYNYEYPLEWKFKGYQDAPVVPLAVQDQVHPIGTIIEDPHTHTRKIRVENGWIPYHHEYTLQETVFKKPKDRSEDEAINLLTPPKKFCGG